MKTNLTLQPFPLGGTAVHVTPGGDTSVLRGDDLKARLRRLPDGLLLGAFPVARDVDTHPHMWELHPMGDELIVMLTGALDVEYADELRRGTCSVATGEGVVVPKGVWHRLELREPGLLLTLTPLQGTRHSDKP